MGKPYSIDLRERVVAAVLTGGLSCNRAAKQFEIGISTAINWVNRLRETGNVSPGQMGATSRRRLLGSTGSGCCNAPRTETSPCAGLSPSLPNVG